MTHGAWRQRALILQGRPVRLVEGRAEAQPVARRDRLDLARRARDLDLVVGEESLEAPLLGDAGRCSAPSLESLRLAQRAVDDVGVGRPERAAGGAELVAEDLDAPYVEAQGSADIAARENVAQEREVAVSLTRFSFLTLNRREPSFSSDLMPRKE